MNIVFLPSTKADLRWFKRYYTSVFPEGRRNADQQYRAFLALLRNHPMIGAPADGVPNAREHRIRNTPFSVIYRVTPDEIQIIRLSDQRSAFSNERKR